VRQQQTQALPQPDHDEAGDKEKSAHEQNWMLDARLGAGPVTRQDFPGKFTPGKGAWRREAGRLKGINRGRKGHGLKLSSSETKQA